MRPLLSPDQGRIVRAIVTSLSNGGEDSVTVGGPARFVIDAIESTPWASLTFAGERHRLAVRLPGCSVPTSTFAGNDLVVPRRIVAVESAERAETSDGAVLTLDLLTIKENDFSSSA